MIVLLSVLSIMLQLATSFYILGTSEIQKKLTRNKIDMKWTFDKGMGTLKEVGGT